MSTKAKRHVHKYHKVDMGFSSVWACALPDCSHYMPKHMENTIEGKFSLCWGCGEKFILDVDAMKLTKPMCFNCRTGSTKEEETAPMSENLRALLEHLDKS